MTKKERQFIQTVWNFYRTHKRSTLPWRATKNPYHILISEVMLQQTQIERVLPKYNAFLHTFPAIQDLAEAPLRLVLQQWQGLGYNRRAKMLHACAQEVFHIYRGKLPKTHKDLCKLPGVGPYTAGAILAFAYNIAVPIIETNIRTVFHHHFFKNKKEVSDKELLHFITRTLDTQCPQQWYWALMDYGDFLKRKYGSINSLSKHYVKQSPFRGSNREIRGAIIRILVAHNEAMSLTQIQRTLPEFDESSIDIQLQHLLQEEMLVRIEKKIMLPD